MIARLKEYYLKILHERKERCEVARKKARQAEENQSPLVTIKCDPDIEIKTETEINE